MYQLVHVYHVEGAFLLHPNSSEGAISVANGPGLAITEDAPSEFLGQFAQKLRIYCKNNIPKSTSLRSVNCPLFPLAGVKSWGNLSRRSPSFVSVRFADGDIKLTRNIRDGAGYSADIAFDEVTVPISTSEPDLGKQIHSLLLPET
jgi:hypothetical protein